MLSGFDALCRHAPVADAMDRGETYGPPSLEEGDCIPEDGDTLGV